MAGETPGKRRGPMPDVSRTTPADSGGIWRGLRALLFGDEADETLRTRLEEVIDEHEGEPGPDAKGDLSTLEREMVRNMLHFGERDAGDRSEERSVGKEFVSTCRCRW